MKLLIDPAVNAHRHHLLHVAGSRSKREAIECVNGALLLVGRGLGIFILLLSEKLRDGARKARNDQKSQHARRFGSHGHSGWKRPLDYEPLRQKKLLSGMVRRSAELIGGQSFVGANRAVPSR